MAADAPPSYDTLFGELRVAKETSAGNMEFAKKSKDVICRKFAGTCCLVFTLLIIICLAIALPITEIVIGAQNLNDCPHQRLLPIYLVVLGAFSLVSGLGNCFKQISSHRREDEEEGTGSKVVGCCKGLIELFIFAWFICGNVWVFKMKKCADDMMISANTTNCFSTDSAYSGSTVYCAELLYEFVFWSTIAKWILVGSIIVIGIFGCCLCCCVAVCCGKST